MPCISINIPHANEEKLIIFNLPWGTQAYSLKQPLRSMALMHPPPLPLPGVSGCHPLSLFANSSYSVLIKFYNFDNWDNTYSLRLTTKGEFVLLQQYKYSKVLLKCNNCINHYTVTLSSLIKFTKNWCLWGKTSPKNKTPSNLLVNRI